MNREQYLEFLRLDDEARQRVEEIFRYAKRDDIMHPSIDSINFEEGQIKLAYYISGYTMYIKFPSELVFSNDWKNQYDLLTEKQRQEKERKELEEKRIREERDKSIRHALYLKFKEEFEGK